MLIWQQSTSMVINSSMRICFVGQKKLSYELIWPLERTGYILSYCCPPNIARALAQVGEYFYSVDHDGRNGVVYMELMKLNSN